MPVSAYMQTCLHDPADGYYARGAGLGRDFITAPETSQMFGELLGLWLVNEWRAIGDSSPFNLVELGGGRGTLMADALRAAFNIAGSDLAKLMSLTLIEASPDLKKQQAKALKAYLPDFKNSIEEVTPGISFILANEFLDCLPARQFVQDGEVWRERIVGLGEDGEPVFGIDRSDLTAEAAASIPPVGVNAEAELQPGLDGLVDTLLARHEQGDRFRALFIDYGPADRAPGNTLRAYRHGEQIDLSLIHI